MGKQIVIAFTGVFSSALALILAHISTTIIQADPLAARLFLEKFEERAPLGAWLLPAAVATCLVIWILMAFGRKSGRIGFEHARRYLEHFFSPLTVTVIFAAFLLPMRQMDNNSGYVNVDPQSPLAWLLFILDLARSFAAFRFTMAMLSGLESNTIISASSKNAVTAIESGKTDVVIKNVHERPLPNIDGYTLPRIFMILPALIGFIVALGIQFGPLENIPHVQDEIIQDWQARTLAEGMSHSMPMIERASFQTDRLNDSGAWLFSSYQPALSIIWSLFIPFGTIGLINPILAILSLFLWNTIVRRAVGETIGSYATAALAISPFFWIMASGRMNHILALFLLLGAIRGLIATCEARTMRGAIIAGLSCGVLIMTRRVDAVAAFASLLITVMSISSITIPRRIRFLLVTLAFAGGVVFVQTGFSRACSGDALSMIRWGQAMARNWWDIAPGALVSNFFDLLCGFSFYAFGGTISGIVCLLFLSPRTIPLDRFLVIHAFLTLFSYGCYDFQDFCYGPRFWFGLLPAATLGLARAFMVFSHAAPPQSIRAWRLCIAGFALLTVINQSYAMFGREFWHVDRRFERTLSSLSQPSLVFIQSPTRRVLSIARALGRLGFNSQEMAFAATPGIDAKGLCDELASMPSGMETRNAAMAIISRHVETAARRYPERFEINRIEAIRLNGPKPLEQRIIVALDLGDKANEALRAKLAISISTASASREVSEALPHPYVSLIASRRDDSIELEPYTTCGVSEFQDADAL
ncbi:MAG: hypothetical protein HQM09_07950 [Candidatus Riflebacteria bacterium]|nr:hypothetical protein [Candidatus Riflebacteria bacterium]